MKETRILVIRVRYKPLGLRATKDVYSDSTLNKMVELFFLMKVIGFYDGTYRRPFCNKTFHIELFAAKRTFALGILI